MRCAKEGSGDFVGTSLLVFVGYIIRVVLRIVVVVAAVVVVVAVVGKKCVYRECVIVLNGKRVKCVKSSIPR